MMYLKLGLEVAIYDVIVLAAPAIIFPVTALCLSLPPSKEFGKLSTCISMTFGTEKLLFLFIYFGFGVMTKDKTSGRRKS
jgi:hypothetical protein